ncbi:hypothetical protein KLP28_05895 [Nocardioidaceae bacterium]|nr:hypothetical protein KLP28_05895 [Nocardioidaceae bacterium]
MARRLPDLRDHPVLAIMAGFLVLALIAVPTLLVLTESSQGPAGADRPAGSPATRNPDGPEASGPPPTDLDVSTAQPVTEAAADVISQDMAFPGWRAQLLTMSPQVDESAPTTDGDLEETTEAEAAAAGWVEVYALTPEDAPERGPGEALTQQQIGILVRSGEGGVRTRRVVGEDAERPAPAQIYSASYDAGTVVWQETTSTDAASRPFRIYSWSTSSGETTELAASPEVDGADAPPVAGLFGLVLRADTVLWSQAAAGEDGGPVRTDVLGCTVSECEPTLVRRDAAYPTAGPRGFALLARDVTEAGDDQQVVSLVEVGADLTPDGDPVPLPASVGTVTGFAGADSGYVLLETPPQEPTRAILFDGADDDRPRVVVGPPAGGFVYAAAGRRLVAWGFAGAAQEPVGGYVYDRATDQLLSLGDSSARYSVAVAQGRVAFQVAEEAPDGLPGQRVALLP